MNSETMNDVRIIGISNLPAISYAVEAIEALSNGKTVKLDTKEFLDMQGKNVRVSEMAITLWKDEDDGMERGKG